MADGTQHQFGYQWNIYREVLPIHEAQFKRWIQPLTVDFFKDKDFLDAGCGMGRNSLWPLTAGAKSGYAFDYDQRSVAAAKETLEKFSNCTVAFKSIYDIEFRDQFDIVFSLGVVHHLENPRLAVKNLCQSLRVGGKLILMVYSHEGNELYLKIFDPIRKHITSRIHPRITRIFAKLCASFIWLYVQLPNQSEYFKLLKQAGYRNIENIIFDQMIPSIANYWTRQEVLDLLEGLPLENISLVHTNGITWSITATRTA